ncbi:MAG: peptidylprolyl isomerase [Alphaproteobacteria bacterium]
MPVITRPVRITAARAIIFAIAIALAPTAPAMAQDDPVVARVDDHEITRSDVEREAAGLPQQYQQMPFETIFPTLRDRAIDTALLADAAAARALDEDPEVQEAIDEAIRLILRNRLIEATVDAAVSEKALRAAYDARADDPGFARDEVKARHILVDERAAAADIIAELDGGADFAALAAERSTGPSGERGGDLGWFSEEEMVGPFAEAAFALTPGEVSTEPVETRFGFHVIKVEDRRTTTPSFEDSRAELEQELGRQAVTALLDELRAAAAIERFDLEGQPDEPAN